MPVSRAVTSSLLCVRTLNDDTALGWYPQAQRALQCLARGQLAFRWRFGSSVASSTFAPDYANHIQRKICAIFAHPILLGRKSKRPGCDGLLLSTYCASCEHGSLICHQLQGGNVGKQTKSYGNFVITLNAKAPRHSRLAKGLAHSSEYIAVACQIKLPAQVHVLCMRRTSTKPSESMYNRQNWSTSSHKWQSSKAALSSLLSSTGMTGKPIIFRTIAAVLDH